VQTKRLLEEKKNIETRFEELQEVFRKGKICEEEYSKRKYDLEREFVEVMDRLAQMKFISGE
jgi:uncharacterized membrane protein